DALDQSREHLVSKRGEGEVIVEPGDRLLPAGGRLEKSRQSFPQEGTALFDRQRAEGRPEQSGREVAAGAWRFLEQAQGEKPNEQVGPCFGAQADVAKQGLDFLG